MSRGDGHIASVAEHVLSAVNALVDGEVGVEGVVSLAAIRAASAAHFECLGGAIEDHLVDFDGLESGDAHVNCTDLGLKLNLLSLELGHANINIMDAGLDCGQSCLQLLGGTVVISENGVEGVNLDLKGSDFDGKIGLMILDGGEASADVLGGGLERADLNVEVVGGLVLVVHVQLKGGGVIFNLGNAVEDHRYATLAVIQLTVDAVNIHLKLSNFVLNINVNILDVNNVSLDSSGVFLESDNTSVEGESGVLANANGAFDVVHTDSEFINLRAEVNLSVFDIGHIDLNVGSVSLEHVDVSADGRGVRLELGQTNV